MPQVMHRLVGYDRRTDRMTGQFDIPDHLFPEAKKIAKVPRDDPEASWSYPLNDGRAEQLATLIGANISLQDAEFFLEAFAMEQDNTKMSPSARAQIRDSREEEALRTIPASPAHGSGKARKASTESSE